MTASGDGAPADLAVVGAGIVGAWTAYQAARDRPGWRVTVLERAGVGGGASVHSAGVSFPVAATAGHVPLVRAGRAEYARLTGPAAAHVRPVPMIYVTADRAGLAGRLVDSPPHPLTGPAADRLHGLLPGLRIGAGEAVVTHDEPGFAVDAAGLAAALLGASGLDGVRTAGRGPGITVRTGTPVTRIDRAGGLWSLRTPDGEVTAHRVVLACGPWHQPPVGPVPLPEAPGARRKRIAALHVALDGGPGDPLVSFVDDDLFVLPTVPGEALVSFYREEWDPDPDVLDGGPSAADLTAGLVALARRSPALAAAVTGGRAFCDLYTPHRLPTVVTAPDLPGLAAVRGGSGSGVRLAPGLAAAALAAVDAAPVTVPAGAPTTAPVTAERLP